MIPTIEASKSREELNLSKTRAVESVIRRIGATGYAVELRIYERCTWYSRWVDLPTNKSRGKATSLSDEGRIERNDPRTIFASPNVVC